MPYDKLMTIISLYLYFMTRILVSVINLSQSLVRVRTVYL